MASISDLGLQYLIFNCNHKRKLHGDIIRDILQYPTLEVVQLKATATVTGTQQAAVIQVPERAAPSIPRGCSLSKSVAVTSFDNLMTKLNLLRHQPCSISTRKALTVPGHRDMTVAYNHSSCRAAEV